MELRSGMKPGRFFFLLKIKKIYQMTPIGHPHVTLRTPGVSVLA